MLGVISANCLIYVKKYSFGKSLSIIGITIAIISLVSFSYTGKVYFRLLFALGVSMLIIGFIDIEGKRKIRFWGVLLLLGNASYSVYLIHSPILALTQRLFAKFNTHWALALTGGILIATFAGIAYHLVVEKKFIRFFKNILINDSATESEKQELSVKFK